MNKKSLALFTGVAMLAIGLVPPVMASQNATTNLESVDSISLTLNVAEPFGTTANAGNQLTVTSSTDNTGQTLQASTCTGCSTIQGTLTSNSNGGARVTIAGTGVGEEELVHSSNTPTVTNTALGDLTDQATSLAACGPSTTGTSGIFFRILPDTQAASNTDTTFVYTSTTSGTADNFDATITAKYGSGADAANTFWCTVPAAASPQQFVTTDEYNETGQVFEMDVFAALLTTATSTGTLKSGEYSATWTMTPFSNGSL